MITVPLYIIILTISPHYIIYSIVSTVYHHDQSMYTVIGYHHNYIVPLYSTHCIHSMPSCLMLHHSLGMSHCYHWRLRRSDAALFRALGWAGRRHLAPRGEAVDSQRLGRAGRLHRAVAPGGCTGLNGWFLLSFYSEKRTTTPMFGEWFLNHVILVGISEYNH